MPTAREHGQKWRDTHPGAQYAANKKWRLSNPDKRNAAKARNYAQTGSAPNSGRPWTQAEDQLVREHSIPDRELSAKIGRSVRAIQIRRNRITKAQPEAPGGSQ